jgi:hypothetical protein
MTAPAAEAKFGELAPPRGWLGRVRRGAVLVVAAGGDAVSFYGALAIADPNLDERMVTAAVLALTSATVGLMHFAGVSARKRRLAGSTLRSWPIGTLLVLWLAMGVSAFVIRLVGEPVDTGLGLAGAAPVAEAGLAPQQFGLALLMLTLFLGTGGMAAWAAYNGHDPEHDRGVALRRARRRFRRRTAMAAFRRRVVSACTEGARRTAVAVARAVRERRARLRRARPSGSRRRPARRPSGVRHWHARGRSASPRWHGRRPSGPSCSPGRRRSAPPRWHARRAERSALLARQAAELLLRTLEDRERQAHETLTTAVAAHEQVVDLVQRRKADAARDADRLRAAQRTVDPWAHELRDHARLRLAAALSDPATTTALTAPQLPRPSLQREDVS